MRGSEKIGWETVAGAVTLIGAFISVMTVVVKVNRTMTRLEEAVRQLREFIENQDERNEHFVSKLASHETRISLLENRSRDKKE